MTRFVHTFLLAAAPAILFAQSDGVRPVFYVGGGPTFTNARLSDYTKTGYNIAAGAGIRAAGIELTGEFGFHDLGVKQSVLASLAVPGGNARVMSVTGNVKIPLLPGPVQPYVIGGGGWYRRTVEFTEPTTSFVRVFDPWWGYVGDLAVPADRVLGSVSRDAGGVNAGGGLQIAIGGGAKIFAHVKWHRAYHNPTNTTLVPITAGISF